MTLWVMMKGGVMFGDEATADGRLAAGKNWAAGLFCFSNFKRRSFFIEAWRISTETATSTEWSKMNMERIWRY
jgi:hypothetical protein